MSHFSPAETFPPGEYLKLELEARGWTQTDLAAILGRPIRLVNEIIMGKRGISPETAAGLSQALGTDAEVWLRLEAMYQLSRVHRGDDDAVERRARLYSKAPINDMIRRHWLEPSDNIDVLEQQVLDFYGKTSLDDDFATAHAAKKSKSYETVTSSQAAWLARARQLALAVSVRASYRRGTVEDLFEDLRNLMHAPEETRLVPRYLADAGIRLVIVEPLVGTGIDGASFWLDSISPVIALSVRYDRIDNFWFVLAHELAHTEREDALKREPTVDIELDARGERPPAERAANDYASRHLIPEHEMNDFIVRNKPLYSAFKIKGFASRLEVHPGIVVGRLQYLDEIKWSHHRRMLAPIRQEITTIALTDGWGHIAPVGKT